MKSSDIRRMFEESLRTGRMPSKPTPPERRRSPESEWAAKRMETPQIPAEKEGSVKSTLKALQSRNMNTVFQCLLHLSRSSIDDHVLQDEDIIRHISSHLYGTHDRTLWAMCNNAALALKKVKDHPLVKQAFERLVQEWRDIEGRPISGFNLMSAPMDVRIAWGTLGRPSVK